MKCSGRARTGPAGVLNREEPGFCKAVKPDAEARWQFARFAHGDNENIHFRCRLGGPVQKPRIVKPANVPRGSAEEMHARCCRALQDMGGQSGGRFILMDQDNFQMGIWRKRSSEGLIQGVLYPRRIQEAPIIRATPGAELEEVLRRMRTLAGRSFERAPLLDNALMGSLRSALVGT